MPVRIEDVTSGGQEIQLHQGPGHAASSQPAVQDEEDQALQGDGPQTRGQSLALSLRRQEEEGRPAMGLHVFSPSGCSRIDSACLVVAEPRPCNSARFLDPVRGRLSVPQQGTPTEEDSTDVATLGGRLGGGDDGFLSTSGSSELRKAEEENRMLRERQSCKICCKSPIDCVFMPCSHRFSCLSCSYRSLQEQEERELPARCPVCRQETSVLPYRQ